MIDFEADTSGGHVLLEYIRDVEGEIGFDFPKSYVEFIERSNGGVPLKKFFVFDGGEKVVERFLSFVDNYKESEFGIYDVEVVWSQIESRLNDELCPFAILFSGDFLCFESDLDGNCRVVIWDHELSRDNSPVIYYVSPSFDEFIKELY